MRAAAAVTIAGISAHAQPVYAQEVPPPVDLTWEAPAACPLRASILDDIAKMVRTSTNPRPVRARAVVKETGGTTYAVDLSLEGGNRHLEADRCDTLADSVALIVALAIDPNAKPLPKPSAASAGASPSPSPSPSTSTPTSTSTSTPTPTSTPTSTSTSTPTPTPTPTSTSTRKARGLLVVGAAATLDTASLPKPALGPSALLGLRLARLFRAEAYGALFTAQTTSLGLPGAGGGEVSARVRGLTAGARGGPTFRAGTDALEITPQAGVSIHSLSATAQNARQRSGSGSAQWAGAMVGALVTFAPDPLAAFRAGVEADIPLGSPEFVIENGGSVHKPSLSAIVSAGFELRFF